MEPIIKIPGGKRDHLVLSMLIKRARETAFHSYCEPFFGGGAAFFALHTAGLLSDRRCYLGDLDDELIDLYEAVVADPEAVAAAAVREREHVARYPTQSERKIAYFDARQVYNSGNHDPGLQLYLRHAAYNGLFRRNRDGFMNTPPRDALHTVRIPDAQHLARVATALAPTTLYSASFAALEAEDGAVPNDLFIEEGWLVYADPPYDCDFRAYTRHGFGPSDQEALVAACAAWAARGAVVYYSNSNTPAVRSLLAEHWPDAQVDEVYGKRTISRDAATRAPAAEVIAHN